MGLIKNIYAKYLRNSWHMKSKFGAQMLAEIFLRDYKNYSWIKSFVVHKYGFTVKDWSSLGLDEKNCYKFLSRAHYYAMHPLNGQYSHWIDDKLTLKNLCVGTELDKYMPAYYFEICKNGSIVGLLDYDGKKNNLISEDIVALLNKKKKLAFKPMAGSLGEGFYKAYSKEGLYYLNDTPYNFNDFTTRIGDLRGYLVTEYLDPHTELARFSPKTPNTIRLLAGKLHGRYIRLMALLKVGTKQSNYVDNYMSGGVMMFLDDNGYYTCGNILRDGQQRVIQTHPDTGVELKGKVPLWEEMSHVVDLIGEIFPQLNYIGVDFAATDKKEVKILEINSLSSYEGLPLREISSRCDAREFFENHIRRMQK